VGLREVNNDGHGDWRGRQGNLELKILPLPKHFPMYLEESDKLRFAGAAAGAAISLSDVQVVPQYRLVLQTPASR
jgi:beta-galactosidase